MSIENCPICGEKLWADGSTRTENFSSECLLQDFFRNMVSSDGVQEEWLIPLLVKEFSIGGKI